MGEQAMPDLVVEDQVLDKRVHVFQSEPRGSWETRPLPGEEQPVVEPAKG
jgi:hypothetical protein